METCINTTSVADVMAISSDERHFISVCRKLSEQYPDDVKIIRQPDENDGCIVATFPRRWLYIRKPTQRNLTDEQKAELVERMKGMHRVECNLTDDQKSEFVERMNEIHRVEC